MTIHPVAPLTPENQRYYEDIAAAKELMQEARSVDERIILVNAIGEATSWIWYYRRNQENAQKRQNVL